MTRGLVVSIFAFTLFTPLPGIYSCDTNPEVERDTITLTWPIFEYAIGEEPFFKRKYSDEQRVVGVKVCVEDRPDIKCSDTGSDGCFLLEGVPKNSDVLLSFKKNDYVSRLVPVKTGQRDFIACVSEGMLEEFWKLQLDLAYIFPPMIKAYGKNELTTDEQDQCDEEIEASLSPKSDYGEIAAIVLKFPFNPKKYPIEDFTGPVPLARTAVSISPHSDPIYTDCKGVPCYRGVNGDSGIRNGYALFTKLKEGDDYLVKFEVPENYFCIIASLMTDRMFWGFRDETPNQTRVPVRKGHSTITSIKCYSTSEIDMLDADIDAESSTGNQYPLTDAGLDSQTEDVNRNDAPSETE